MKLITAIGNIVLKGGERVRPKDFFMSNVIPKKGIDDREIDKPVVEICT